MNVMVYFKGKGDKRFSPMNPITGELFSRLVYAPLLKEDMIPAIIDWIEENKVCAPDCHIQIRAAGTSRILYR